MARQDKHKVIHDIWIKEVEKKGPFEVWHERYILYKSEEFTEACEYVWAYERWDGLMKELREMLKDYARKINKAG